MGTTRQARFLLVDIGWYSVKKIMRWKLYMTKQIYTKFFLCLLISIISQQKKKIDFNAESAGKKRPILVFCSALSVIPFDEISILQYKLAITTNVHHTSTVQNWNFLFVLSPVFFSTNICWWFGTEPRIVCNTNYCCIGNDNDIIILL